MEALVPLHVEHLWLQHTTPTGHYACQAVEGTAVASDIVSGRRASGQNLATICGRRETSGP